MSSRSFLLALPPLALAASALLPHPARACQPPPCYPAAVPFPAGTSVPANTPWIPFQVAGDFQTNDPAKSPPRVVAADGTTVPTTFTSARITPTAPLMPGQQYKIVYSEGCQTNATREHAFTAGPAQPRMPLAFEGGSAGTVSVTTSIEPYTEFGPCGQQTRIEKAAVARVRFTPSAGARAWAALAHLGFELDRLHGGITLPGGDYGRLARGPEVVATYYANCAGGTPQGNLAPGRHQIFVWLYVGDEKFVAPSSAEFDLTCGPPTPDDGGVAADAGTAPADTGTAPADAGTALADAGTVAADGGAPADAAPAPMPTATPAATSGCTLAGRGSEPPSSLWLAMAVMALAALVVRRRARF